MIQTICRIQHPRGDGDRFGLVVPFKAVGQRSVIDSALMRLECGYMSITKDREAIGTKLKTLTNRVRHESRLVRQSINQVKIYAFHAGPPQFNRRRAVSSKLCTRLMAR